MRGRIACVIVSVRAQVREGVRGHMKEGHRGETRSEPYRGGQTYFLVKPSRAAEVTPR
jgi:hypothetical protein